jgi:hypothetical protein
MAEKIRIEADYFERNAERMRYPRSVCWTRGKSILALRCSYLNGRFEDYWEERREARAA